MAKFEIEAKIGANSAEFQQKLKAASAETREFARSVKENMSQAKDVFGELGGAAGLGKFTSALASGSLAAAAFGAAIIEACKGGMEAYSKLQESAFKFGEILHDPAKGQEIAKSIEEMPGHMGNKEDMNQAMISLLDTFSNLPDAADRAMVKLKEFQNASAKGAGSMAEMAEQYRRFNAAGPDASAGGSKLLKSMKELAPMIDAEKKKEEEALQRDVNYFGSRNRPEEVAKIAALKAESNVDFVKTLTPKKLDEMMAAEYGSGGPSGSAAEDRKNTPKGQQEDIGAIKEQLLSAFGEGYAEPLKKVLDELITELPTLTSTAKQLGEELGALITWIDKIRGNSPEEAGRKYGETTQQAVLENKFGMRFDPTGNPIAQTPLERHLNEMLDTKLKVGRGGYTDESLFGSNTGGKDLQQAQLETMKRIEENTAKQVDVQ